MTSPFPGMDPYLEISGDWRDFHARFIDDCCDAINDQLPENYVARIDERFTLLELPDGRDRGGYPDVSVLRSGPSPRRAGGGAGVATLEPVTLRLLTDFPEQERQTFIEVRRLPGATLVTSVELLSPTNKAGTGRTEYLAKRRALTLEPVHLVEIDLLAAGHRLPADDPLPPGDYYAFVSRADRRPDSEAYAWTVRDPLPTIPIPLRAPDPDVRLDLAAVFATSYRRGRYERTIDYAAPLAIPLHPEDRAWAEALARAGRA